MIFFKILEIKKLDISSMREQLPKYLKEIFEIKRNTYISLSFHPRFFVNHKMKGFQQRKRCFIFNIFEMFTFSLKNVFQKRYF